MKQGTATEPLVMGKRPSRFDAETKYTASPTLTGSGVVKEVSWHFDQPVEFDGLNPDTKAKRTYVGTGVRLAHVETISNELNTVIGEDGDKAKIYNTEAEVFGYAKDDPTQELVMVFTVQARAVPIGGRSAKNGNPDYRIDYLPGRPSNYVPTEQVKDDNSGRTSTQVKRGTTAHDFMQLVAGNLTSRQWLNPDSPMSEDLKAELSEIEKLTATALLEGVKAKATSSSYGGSTQEMLDKAKAGLTATGANFDAFNDDEEDATPAAEAKATEEQPEEAQTS